MKGIDISHHHPDLDVASIKGQGFEFVILRTSSGMSTRDRCFEDQYRQAAAADIPVGVFVDSYATTEEAAVREAQFALRILSGRPAPLGIYMDIEDQGGQYSLGRAQLSAVIRAFCWTIRQAGYKPGLYGSELGVFSLVDAGAFGDALIWVARYGREPGIQCDLWQMTNEGRIAGYDRNLDTDIVRSDRFRALVRGAAEPEPKREQDAETTAIVRMLQACMAQLGYWPAERVDGVKSKEFREAFVSYAADVART